MAKNFRLYIKEELELGENVSVDENQAHYLRNVVKYSVGDELSCFDNKNGEFLCVIKELNKKNAILEVKEKIRDFVVSPDIWLLFAPLKKDNTDFVIQKATELGCRKIIPIITKHTITNNIKIKRYVAQSIEASEQCRRTDLPEISLQQDLKSVLNGWDSSRILFFMDETLESNDFLSVLKENPTKKGAILVGPEGGFSDDEIDLLRSLSFCKGATLGPRILRAETAVLASLSCWQLISGDWSN